MRTACSLARIRLPCLRLQHVVYSAPFGMLLLIFRSDAKTGGNWVPERPSARFAFVHVPKTGGQSVRRCALEPSCSDVRVSPRAHAFTESSALAAGLAPIVILRHPLERLRSAFVYWQKGSMLIRQSGVGSYGSGLRAKARGLTFERFVHGYANASASSALRAQVAEIVNAPQFVGGWAWSAHFASSRTWADRESPRTVFVCYSQSAMTARLECLGASLGIRCNFSHLARLNPARSDREMAPRTFPSILASSDRAQTRPSDQTAGAGAIVDVALLQLLRQRLGADFELHERHCSMCTASCQCCHSLVPTGVRGGLVHRLARSGCRS